MMAGKFKRVLLSALAIVLLLTLLLGVTWLTGTSIVVRSQTLVKWLLIAGIIAAATIGVTAVLYTKKTRSKGVREPLAYRLM